MLEVDLSSLTKIFDPHSAYMSAKNWEDMLNQQLHLSLQGIGASLQSEDGYAVVVEIVPGAAADKDGRLQPGDKILGVKKDNGRGGEDEIDFVEKKLSDVVRHIRGDRGTKVKLIVQPEGSKEKRIYELTREKIELKEQHAKGKVLQSKDASGKEIKIGVISLPAFYGDTMALLRGDRDAVSATADCRKLLDQFKTDKVDCVIVDLRGNGGGLLEEARTLSGLFIDTGPVVQVKQASGVQSLADDDEGTAWEGPLVVLIDKMSASASEIFAGVIKDYNRGLIIGDVSTFGKGTVQSIEPVSDHLRRRAGTLVPDDRLIATLERIERINDSAPITVFEVITAAAFDLFAATPADLCVLEVGLGGRGDATNVIDPPASCAITSISLDHRELLGPSVDIIAGEKAGIMKPGVPVAIGAQQDNVRRVLLDHADATSTPVRLRGRDWDITPTGTGFRYTDSAGAVDAPAALTARPVPTGQRRHRPDRPCAPPPSRTPKPASPTPSGPLGCNTFTANSRGFCRRIGHCGWMAVTTPAPALRWPSI